MTGTLNVDVYNLSVTYAIKEKNMLNKNYDSMSGGRLNMCNMQQGAAGSILANLISNIDEKYSNIKVSCPQKKGFYFIINAPISDMSLVPGMLLLKSSERVFTLKARGKKTASKSMDEIVSLEATFKIDVTA